MNFQKPIGPHDERSLLFNSYFQQADPGFTGVDERTPPQLLPPGYCASAKNKRFRAGRATDRGGIAICRWMKGDGTVPFTEVYCWANYSSPGAGNTAKWIIIAADGGIWKTRPNTVATPVPLPQGIVLTNATAIQFVQGMNVLILMRGPDNEELSMPDIDTGFQTIAQTQAGIDAGTTPIPPSSFGAYVLNRVVVVTGRDFIAASDIGDYTSYQEVTETFQINQGDADSLVAFAVFNQNQLVCLKSNSVYLVQGLSGNLDNATGPFFLTDEYGCVAPRSVVTRGTNVYWLSQAGIATVQLTELNQTQATTEMLTDQIPITFARINNLFVGNACAEIWNNRLYMAVALDDSTTNNGVLVFDFLNQAWCGSDEAAGVISVVQFLRFTWNGTEQLLALCADGYIRQWEVGFEDEIVQPIAAPYFDMLINTAPPIGTTLQLGSGVLVTAVNNPVDTGTQWGCDNDTDAEANFIAGFLSNGWLTGSAITASAIEGGIRFQNVSAGNIKVNGASATGNIGFAWIDDFTQASLITVTPVQSQMITRAFNCLDIDQKRFLSLLTICATWNPSYTITTAVNGANQTTAYVTNVTKDPTQYDNFGTAPYDLSNVNGDASAAKRLDYSVCADDLGVFGAAINLDAGDGTGVNLDQTQDTIERLTVDEKGFWQQLQFNNATGTHEVKLLLMEAIPADRDDGSHN